MNKSYYTIPEFAKILGVSRIAIYKKVKNGSIKAIRIGKVYLIPKRYVQSIIGNTLNENNKKIIDEAVKKTIQDYGEVLKKLGNE